MASSKAANSSSMATCSEGLSKRENTLLVLFVNRTDGIMRITRGPFLNHCKIEEGKLGRYGLESKYDEY